MIWEVMDGVASRGFPRFDGTIDSASLVGR